MRYVSDTRPKTAFVRELRDNHTTTKERYKKELFLTERPFKDLFKALTRPLKKLSKTFNRLLKGVQKQRSNTRENISEMLLGRLAASEMLLGRLAARVILSRLGAMFLISWSKGSTS